MIEFAVLVLGVAFACAALGIWANRHGAAMNRIDFAFRAAALTGALTVASRFVNPSEVWVAIAALVLAQGAVGLLAYWAVERLRDIGLGRAYALLVAVPIINWIFLVYLMLRKGRASPAV